MYSVLAPRLLTGSEEKIEKKKKETKGKKEKTKTKAEEKAGR